MKDVKLRECNSKRYCPNCRETIKLVMKGENGYCPNCEEKLYTIDNRGK